MHYRYLGFSGPDSGRRGVWAETWDGTRASSLSIPDTGTAGRDGDWGLRTNRDHRREPENGADGRSEARDLAGSDPTRA